MIIRRVNFILSRKIIYCTKEILKITNIAIIAFIIIGVILFIKYKPSYKVIINDEEIGYIENKKEVKKQIEEYIQQSEKCVAFRTIEAEEIYQFQLVERSQELNSENVISKIKDNTKTIYMAYAILVDDDISYYVETEEEANTIINELKQKATNTNINIQMRQIYTDQEIEVKETNFVVAKLIDSVITPTLAKQEKKQEENKGTIVQGITLAVRPVSGTITSRYGVRSSIRSGAHTGLDIAAKTGTAIKVTAGGTVTFSGRSGSYGNLIKVTHGNGVETWYGHCSKLYAKQGDIVSAGDIIAAVGSTGNSTGPHLHFEVRINGNTVNPQKYIY